MMRLPQAPCPPRRVIPRCAARTRAGPPCRNPAVTGKRRCRMHGGAEGSGAQPGNTNALKHGFYTAEAEAEAERSRLRAMMKVWRRQAEDIERKGRGSG